jgi:cell division protein FtsI/penicillin-binding protein 2
MNEDETVYADWGALRYVAPILGGLVLVGGIVLAAVALSGGDDGSSTTDGATSESTVDPSTAETLPVVEPLTPDDVVADFLPILERGRFGQYSFAFNDAVEAQEQFDTIVGQLGPVTVEATASPVQAVDDANVSAPIELAWELEDGTTFTTDGKIDLVLIGTEWLVDWEPSIVETSLDPGDSLVWERVLAPRAPILGRDGFALIDNVPVWDIGVIPRRVDDVPALTDALGGLIGEDPAEILATISPQPSDSNVYIATRRADEVAAYESQLRSLPGVVLTPSTFPLPPDERFARALLGRSAEVTAEIIDEAPELFIAGDVAGRSGLQRIYNERLHGVPGYQVRIERRFPGNRSTSTTTTADTTATTTTDTAAGGETTDTTETDGSATTVPGASGDPDVVYLEAPVAGTPLQLTIDGNLQRAAEDALTRTDLPSAMVVVEVSTGHVLAVANGPGVAFDNFALTGQYPPGSIFKTITAYAAMERGVDPFDPIDCPLTLDVNGRQFSNAEGEVLGTVPMWQNYVLSCNTGFINLASVLEPSDFTSTAARFGVGVNYELGVAAYGGSVPTPGGPVDFAATSFGQSRILFSPLNAAVMAATAAGGAYRPPQLVLEEGQGPAEAQPLDATLADNLRQMMRAVVTNGTGRAVSNVAGGPVSGKTGTAEFGDQQPPEAHAWFVGFQGDLAFAVFVEGGEFGGATAAPIAADFLNRVAR